MTSAGGIKITIVECVGHNHIDLVVERLTSHRYQLCSNWNELGGALGFRCRAAAVVLDPPPVDTILALCRTLEELESIGSEMHNKIGEVVLVTNPELSLTALAPITAHRLPAYGFLRGWQTD